MPDRAVFKNACPGIMEVLSVPTYILSVSFLWLTSSNNEYLVIVGKEKWHLILTESQY